MPETPTFPVFSTIGRYGGIGPVAPNEVIQKMAELAADNVAFDVDQLLPQHLVDAAEQGIGMFAAQLLAFMKASGSSSTYRIETILVAILDGLADFDRDAMIAAGRAEHNKEPRISVQSLPDEEPVQPDSDRSAV